MQIITSTNDLTTLCSKLHNSDYVTVDTEFMRESTYWPDLCLIQIASDTEEAIIDPLSKDLDMSALYDLMADTSVVKVFHAARQDADHATCLRLVTRTRTKQLDSLSHSEIQTIQL